MLLERIRERIGLFFQIGALLESLLDSSGGLIDIESASSYQTADAGVPYHGKLTLFTVGRCVFQVDQIGQERTCVETVGYREGITPTASPIAAPVAGIPVTGMVAPPGSVAVVVVNVIGTFDITHHDP